MKRMPEYSWTRAVPPVLLAALVVGCSPSDAGGPAVPGEPTAFVGVTVVPMDSERVIPDQTVVVDNGRILTIGDAEQVPVPRGAQHIDGAGLYLMPGLADMHGHLPKTSPPDETTEDVLFLYVANGVTTVRGMDGHPSQIELRERVQNGQLVGPQLFLASPEFNGENTHTMDDAERRVREYQAAGFDLLKVHEGLSAGIYDVIAATANEVGIPFAGHVSDSVGLFHTLEAGQATIDHLDNYVEALVPNDGASVVETLFGVEQLLDRVDEDRVELVVEATREAGTGVVPTMVVWENWLYATRPSAELLDEWTEVQYMPPATVQQWAQAVDRRLEEADLEARRELAGLRRRLLLALHGGGVAVLLGTDSPQVFSVPGFAIHREMAFYVDAGLSPYDVLESGTRAVAEHFGAAGDFGTVEVGKRADLLLLKGNPLESVGNVARRAGVMAGGRWLSEDEIQRRLAEIAAHYTAQELP